MVGLVWYKTINYGDYLNWIIPSLFTGGFTLCHWGNAPEGETLYLGIGTLVDYIIPVEWFKKRDVILLGTGTNNFDKPFDAKVRGFARGRLSGRRLGVDGVGDLGILIDRLFADKVERKDYLLLTFSNLKVTEDIISSVKDIARPRPYDATVGLVGYGIAGIYNAIAGSRYVVTDKLHSAMTAEATKTPWVIYDHPEVFLRHGPRFQDWADTIGKSRFIISDLSQAHIIEENNNFEQSEKQKDKLIQRVKELI